MNVTVPPRNCRAGRGVAALPVVVVIGRNEGRRLDACLRSCLAVADRIVYVDSASNDGSADLAELAGVVVVRLHAAERLSAARARNVGFAHAMELWPDARAVQFVDGDCELRAQWLAEATELLEAKPEVGILCGRIRERDRDATVYKRLFDMELDRPAGETGSCGGVFIARAEAFRKAGGFDSSILAGEEPEMCLRVRRSGYRVTRTASEMAVHESAMQHLHQWWRRASRSGYAYAQAVAMHGRAPERLGVRESLSIWLWAAVLPILILSLAWSTPSASVVGATLYPLQVVRVAWRRRRVEESLGDTMAFATAMMIAKWAQMSGQVRFALNHLRMRRGGVSSGA